ncbi:Cyclic nucleotide-binding domain-containing protein [Nakamurella panacisegetis]|uniref:Cyclic nucleotide-binding domain-containing protein n=1 Tax=Nakamurella panacisegetis TaxID=1090615 RepID=A0A1H0QNK5_9ACTN|nr:cyclic nucleotide-binding domain-containing protein [Nakamurella panacisegetis]SDP18951.1 Cyclic nucleotide-binding domain-containing protein [Nakamurella panacisegetis]
MQTVARYLPDHPFLAGLDPAATELLAGCAVAVHRRADEFLFREGAPASHFYLLRHGRVAIESRTPGGAIVLDTVEDGEVTGWSWVVPPYRWTFDGRAITDVTAVALDAACLRAHCQDDPRLGHDLMTRFVRLMNQRLQSARVRLIDMYGGGRHG